MSDIQNKESWEEKFDKLQLGKFENGLHVPCTKEDYHDFIHTAIETAIKEERERILVNAKGHYWDIYETEKMREKWEYIADEYGNLHHPECDINSEDGSVDGCTCEMKNLLDALYALRAKELGELREKIVRASNHEQIRSGDADPWAVTQELLFIVDELIEKPQ